MNISPKFKTIFAVPTPFEDTQSLGICQPALRDHLQALHAAGVTSILVNGTTGEFPSLTLAERKMILECCRSHFPGEVLNNIGTCCISDSLELLAHSYEFADAVVVLPPYYFAPVSPKGLKDFLFSVLNRSAIASYLYNFPKYTQLAISPELLSDIANQVDLLKGIKDSDANLNSAISIKKANPQLVVFSGSDDSLPEVYSAGLDGVVAGGSNAFPEILDGIATTVVAGAAQKTFALQQLFERWKQFRARNSLTSISAVKLAIHSRIPAYPYVVRPPLISALPHLEPDAAKLVMSLLNDHQSILRS